MESAIWNDEVHGRNFHFFCIMFLYSILSWFLEIGIYNSCSSYFSLFSGTFYLFEGKNIILYTQQDWNFCMLILNSVLLKKISIEQYVIFCSNCLLKFFILEYLKINGTHIFEHESTFQ